MLDWTEKEAVEYIACATERRIRDAKVKSIVAFNQAAMIVQLLNGDEVDLMTRFPFWTEEERDEAKRQRLVQYMLNKVGGKPNDR